MIESLATGVLAAALGAPFAALVTGRGRWRGGAEIDVSRVGTAYARVLIPPAIDATAAGDYHDLRVFDDRGREVPYVLDVRPSGAAPKLVAPLSRSFTHGAGTEAVFDLGGGHRHEALTLHVDRDAYFTRVAIDAGDDARTWRTIRDDALVYRLARSGDAASTVSFVPTAARYLRVRVLDGRAAFPLNGVALAGRQTTRPSVVQAGMTTTGSRPDARTQRYTLDLRNEHVQLAAARIDTATPAFARSVDVEGSDDGARWFAVATDRIERFADGRPHLDVEIGDAVARFWRVTIHDDDDAPLDAVTVRLLARPHDLVFAPTRGRRYALLYGDPALDRPVYDLAERLRHETWQADAAGVNAVVLLREAPPPPGAWAVPPWLVASAFASAALSLAGFALRLLHSPAGTDGDPPS